MNLLVLHLERIVISIELLNLILQLLDFLLVLYLILLNILKKSLNDSVLPLFHFILQGLGLFFDLFVLTGDTLEVVGHPDRRFFLCFDRRVQRLVFSLISLLSKLVFSLRDLLEIAILD